MTISEVSNDRRGMQLICYPTNSEPPRIIPAPAERAWMSRSSNSFAYRCLPLNIANAHGWLILNPTPFIAVWNGGPELDAVTVETMRKDTPMLAASHFGEGVLTFSVNGLFRTEPGYDLMVTGPLNEPKDGIFPLTGIVETDWAPFTFTMNWKFTRRQIPIAFERDEPFCMIYPIPRGMLESAEPEFRVLDKEPEIAATYRGWAEGRREFNRDLKVEGSMSQKAKWQKDYFRGDSRYANSPDGHRTKLRAKPFTGP